MARRAVADIPAELAGDELREAIEKTADDALLFVMLVFPWGKEGTPLAKEEGPDVWQVKVLEEIGARVREGKALGEALASAVQIAVASGHGIGKTALISWIILWFMSTRPHPQVVVTANTKQQLTNKTWRELAKWQRLALNGAWFQWSAEKFAAKWAADTWFASAVPWSKDRAEAFAGTHEKHVLLLFDEASAIDDAIWESAEGAMTTAGAMWIAFGNPTRNTGRFRECWRRFMKRWFTLQVDSRQAKKASQNQIKAWEEDYGEDSDFFRVRVRGEFPRAASSQFIAEDDVDAAVARWKRKLRIKQAVLATKNVDPASVRLSVDDCDDEGAGLILACDPARYGDDSTVIYLRRGNIAKLHGRWTGLSTDEVADKVAHLALEIQPDAIFVDEVGLGSGVVDILRRQGFSVTGVNAGMKARNPKAYFNRRVEMYDAMRKWLRAGGCIEDDRGLKEGLTAVEYGFADRSGALQLESKDDMKARNLPSPDEADALGFTFYEPVARREKAGQGVQRMLNKFLRGGAGTSHMSH